MSPTTKIIWDCEGRADQRITLLKKAYEHQTVNQITVIHKYHDGRSGAETFLLDVDGLREIAKFNHPFNLRIELCAYGTSDMCDDASKKGIVAASPTNHRAILKEYVIPDTNETTTEGVLLYSFQGRRRTQYVDSLLEYFNKHDGHKSAAVIERIVDELLHDWWSNRQNRPPVLGISSYAARYDYLLPVHFELELIENFPTRTILKSGSIDRQVIENLKQGDVVEISGFKIISTRNDILRLTGAALADQLYTDLRVKLDPRRQIELLSRPWGSTLEDKYARITKTRSQLLQEAASGANVLFDDAHRWFELNGQKFNNPLSVVDDLLHFRRQEIKLSAVHGDLNLNNIIVDETGYPFVIDFADSRPDGPTFIDLQRLEENVIAFMLTPQMEKANIGAIAFRQILDYLDEETKLEQLPDHLLSLKDPYIVLYTIRQLTKRYRSAAETWEPYYHGLYLVFAGALKYSRTPYQKKLLLIGMAKLSELMKQPPEKSPQLSSPIKPPILTMVPQTTAKIPKIKWLTYLPATLGFLIFVSGILLTGWFSRTGAQGQQWVIGTWTPTPTFTPTATPTLTPTAIPTQPPPTPVPTIAVWQHWPPINGTILARIQKRGYLKCGVAGDLLGFSQNDNSSNQVENIQLNITDAIDRKNGKYRYYEYAKGFDSDICKAIATAIFGTAEHHVLFLNLITGKNKPGEANPERFHALAEGVVDILVRNSTMTWAREMNFEVGPTLIFDGAKIMLSKPEDQLALKNLKTFTQTVAYLETNNLKVCVAVGTTTESVLKAIVRPELIITTNENGNSLNTNLAAFSEYALTNNCDALASDELQLRGRIKANKARFPNETFIPTEEYLSFEPLSPFIHEGDTQWANFVRLVVWMLMRAAMLEVTQKEAQSYIAAKNEAMRFGIINELSAKTGIADENYANFMQIGRANLNGVERFGITSLSSNLLNVIANIGNYEEIFARNVEQILDNSVSSKVLRSINRIYDPLRPTLPDNTGKLIVPPEGWQ